MESTMCLRSSVTKTQRKKELLNTKPQPFVNYSGKTHYFTSFIDCAFYCDKLLEVVNKSSEVHVMGFDMEWPFSFQTGPGKTALIQLSPSLNECYLFHIFKFDSLPKALTELLSHPNVRLAGVNINNDIHKLARDFTSFNKKKALKNCIDSRMQAKRATGLTSWSMEKLVNYFFEMQVNKDKAVRCSKWSVMPLSDKQIVYAAADAYISLKLYLHLDDLEKQQSLKDSENDINCLNS